MASSSRIRASVLGASGYTGAELLRLLLAHPHVEIVSLIAEKSAGQPIGDIFPHLHGTLLPPVIRIEDAKWKEVDVVFCCLPHGTSQAAIKNLPDHLRVIDLSADFRLYDTESYKQWYGHDHLAPELQKQAVYGLSEMFRDPIKNARIVACPGCYPTSALLPLVPLLQRRAISKDDIIIDAKSGISGAGRSAIPANLFSEMHASVRAYNIGKHRHIPEIEQILSAASGSKTEIHFSPHVVPMSRGMLSTIYVKFSNDVHRESDLRDVLEARYKDEPFVRIAPKDHFPSTHEVLGTNHCVIGIARGRTADRAVLVSVIDNLTKGASGQAVQNFNLMFDLPETTGLLLTPLFP